MQVPQTTTPTQQAGQQTAPNFTDAQKAFSKYLTTRDSGFVRNPRELSLVGLTANQIAEVFNHTQRPLRACLKEISISPGSRDELAQILTLLAEHEPKDKSLSTIEVKLEDTFNRQGTISQPITLPTNLQSINFRYSEDPNSPVIKELTSQIAKASTSTTVRPTFLWVNENKSIPFGNALYALNANQQPAPNQQKVVATLNPPQPQATTSTPKYRIVNNSNPLPTTQTVPSQRLLATKTIAVDAQRGAKINESHLDTYLKDLSLKNSIIQPDFTGLHPDTLIALLEKNLIPATISSITFKIPNGEQMLTLNKLIANLKPTVMMNLATGNLNEDQVNARLLDISDKAPAYYASLPGLHSRVNAITANEQTRLKADTNLLHENSPRAPLNLDAYTPAVTVTKPPVSQVNVSTNPTQVVNNQITTSNLSDYLARREQITQPDFTNLHPDTLIALLERNLIPSTITSITFRIPNGAQMQRINQLVAKLNPTTVMNLTTGSLNKDQVDARLLDIKDKATSYYNSLPAGIHSRVNAIVGNGLAYLKNTPGLANDNSPLVALTPLDLARLMPAQPVPPMATSAAPTPVSTIQPPTLEIMTKPTTDIDTLNRILDSIEQKFGQQIWRINPHLMSICDKLAKREEVGIDEFSSYGIEVRYTTQNHSPDTSSEMPKDGTITHHDDQFFLHTPSNPLGQSIQLILKVINPSQFWTAIAPKPASQSNIPPAPIISLPKTENPLLRTNACNNPGSLKQSLIKVINDNYPGRSLNTEAENFFEFLEKSVDNDTPIKQFSDIGLMALVTDEESGSYRETQEESINGSSTFLLISDKIASIEGHPRINITLDILDPEKLLKPSPTSSDVVSSQEPSSQSSTPTTWPELKDRYKTALIEEFSTLTTVMAEFLKSSQTPGECLGKIVTDLKRLKILDGGFQIHKALPGGWVTTFKDLRLAPARDVDSFFDFIIKNTSLSSPVDQSAQSQTSQPQIISTHPLNQRTNLIDSIETILNDQQIPSNPFILYLTSLFNQGTIDIATMRELGLTLRINSLSKPDSFESAPDNSKIGKSPSDYLFIENPAGQSSPDIIFDLNLNRIREVIGKLITVTSSNIPTIPDEVKDLLSVGTKVTYQDIKNLGYAVDITHYASPHNLYKTDLISLREDGRLVFKEGDGRDISTDNFPLNPHVEFRKIIEFTEATKGADDLLKDLTSLRESLILDDCKAAIELTKSGMIVSDFLETTGLQALVNEELTPNYGLPTLDQSAVIKEEAGQWMIDDKPISLVFKIVDPTKVWGASS